MNDADKKAFEAACKDWAAKSAGKDLGEYFWQAACEWRDSQVVGDDLKNQLKKVRESAARLGRTAGEMNALCERMGTEQKIVPLAAQINQQLVESLEHAMWVINSMEQNYGNLWQLDETPESIDSLLTKIRAALAAAKGVKNATD